MIVLNQNFEFTGPNNNVLASLCDKWQFSLYVNNFDIGVEVISSMHGESLVLNAVSVYPLSN